MFIKIRIIASEMPTKQQNTYRYTKIKLIQKSLSSLVFFLIYRALAVPSPSTKVPIQQALEGLAVTCLVLTHFMHSVMDSIVIQRLGSFGKV